MCSFVLGVWCACVAFVYIVRPSTVNVVDSDITGLDLWCSTMASTLFMQLFRMSKPVFMKLLHIIRDDIQTCDLHATCATGRSGSCGSEAGHHLEMALWRVILGCLRHVPCRSLILCQLAMGHHACAFQKCSAGAHADGPGSVDAVHMYVYHDYCRTYEKAVSGEDMC